MRTKVSIFALLTAVCLGAEAQSFSSPADNTFDNNAIQSHQIMPGGTNYEGTVYEPFNNTVPSEQSAVGSSYSPAQAPSGPRRVLINGPETGQGPSPLGDALIPLLLFALAFAAFRHIRSKRTA